MRRSYRRRGAIEEGGGVIEEEGGAIEEEEL
jgi:hypothetical protein